MKWYARVVVMLMAVAGVAAQSRTDRAGLERELAQARSKWTANRPANYEFVLNVPADESWWSREFGIFRVINNSSVTVAPLTGTLAPVFRQRTTVDALFDLVVERIAAFPGSVSPDYEANLGYISTLFSQDYRDLSFEIPVWRAFNELADVREPFALVHHVNHCGSMIGGRTSLDQCPSYSIAIWGDGTVVYDGGAGVRTLDRRQHRVEQDAVRELSRAIADSQFFSMASDYSSGIDHAAEKWITIRADGRYRTVHDFDGAPEALKQLERAIEKSADSRRYTGRDDGGR